MTSTNLKWIIWSILEYLDPYVHFIISFHLVYLMTFSLYFVFTCICLSIWMSVIFNGSTNSLTFFKMQSAARGGSRTAATFKIKRFVIIVNGWSPLTIITKRSILDAAAILNPPLTAILIWSDAPVGRCSSR